MPDDSKPDEPQYTDPETGKPIIYADNVPELLRRPFEPSQMDEKALDELDGLAENPLFLAQKGAESWNLWMRSKAGYWIDIEEKDDCISIRMKPFDKLPAPYKEVHFEPAMLLASGDWQTHWKRDFSGFFFPGRLELRRSTYDVVLDFSNAWFSQKAEFSRSHFNAVVEFSGATFCDEVNFMDTSFNGDVLFKGAVFRNDVSFGGDCHFHKVGDFREVRFEHGAYFESTTFHDGALFHEAEFCSETFFEKVHFATSHFDDAKFYYDVLFNDAIWSGEASFNNMFWRRGCEFKRATFHNSVNANNILAYGYANFSGATFKRSLNLRGSEFLSRASFINCQFLGQVDLDDARFGWDEETGVGQRYYSLSSEAKLFYRLKKVSCGSKNIPNFLGANFAVAPNLSFVHIAMPTLPDCPLPAYQRALVDRYLAWKIRDSKAAAKMRRLEDLADQGHHHFAEKRFFRIELLSRRGHEAITWRENALINLFELFSMCGLSFLRPIKWWLRLFAVFFAVYGGFSGLFEAGWSVEDSFHLVNYTFSNATPVLGVIKASDSAAVQALFNGGAPPYVTLLAGVHNLISTIFLFFALLAIRNYFKLG